MDGLKRRLKESLQLRLSVWLSAVILVVAAVAGAFSFLFTIDEAHEMQDDVLKQVAVLFDMHHLPVPHPSPARSREAYEESPVAVQLLSDGAGSEAATRGWTLPLPQDLPDGLQTVTVSGEAYRVLVQRLASGQRLAVAQQIRFRDESAQDSALHTVMPLLVLVPVLLLVMAHLVRKMFKDVMLLAKEVDSRGEEALYPVPSQHLPLEVRPFGKAINRLLQRISHAMDAQRRFVADAAHELRSPLTALSLQAERLDGAAMSAEARERLATLRQGIERSRGLLDQLLSFARARSPEMEVEDTPSVQRVFRLVLEDLLPLAEARHIDLGVEGEQDAALRLAEVDVFTVVKNLVDNAIRYTPAHGRVDLLLAVESQQVVVQVCDTGPGIAPHEHARVFDPFYRVLGSGEVGSGLGLAIVKAIAERAGARIELGYADEARGSGLRVRVGFPRSPAAG